LFILLLTTLVEEPVHPWTYPEHYLPIVILYQISLKINKALDVYPRMHTHTHTFPLCPSHSPPGLSVVVFLVLAQCLSCKHFLTFSTSVQPSSLSHVKSTHPRLAYTHTFPELMPGPSKTQCFSILVVLFS